MQLINFNTNIDGHRFMEREARTANMGLAKVAVQWLIEHLCFVFATFAKPGNVTGQCKKTANAHSSTFGFARHTKPTLRKTKRA